MYYVCSNIVKPLTEPSQLSFVELIGPTEMKWFVSHYWGMAVRHFNDAIRAPDLQALILFALAAKTFSSIFGRPGHLVGFAEGFQTQK